MCSRVGEKAQPRNASIAAHASALDFEDNPDHETTAFSPKNFTSPIAFVSFSASS
jgi:hypothetical protein